MNCWSCTTAHSFEFCEGKLRKQTTVLSTLCSWLVELYLLNPCGFFGFSLMIDLNSFVIIVRIIGLVTLGGSLGTATRIWVGKSRKISRYVY